MLRTRDVSGELNMATLATLLIVPRSLTATSFSSVIFLTVTIANRRRDSVKHTGRNRTSLKIRKGSNSCGYRVRSELVINYEVKYVESASNKVDCEDRRVFHQKAVLDPQDTAEM